MTTTNTYGRQVVIPLTNKSGGGVIAGDVVIVDSANNDAFTTTTSGAYTAGIGIAQETIASNAIGRVLVSGYAALVNVNASVTRGNFGKTHTVVKQATDAGASRVSGTFGIFLTGGTTPDALIWQPDLGGGSGLTDPMTTRGDSIYRNSSNVTDRLPIPAAGQVIGRVGSDLGSLYPPGYGFDYVEATSLVSITGTTEGTANTVLTGSAVTYDGSTAIMVEFSAPSFVKGAGATAIWVILIDSVGPTVVGQIAVNVGTTGVPCYGRRKLTPSAAAHTYTVKAFTDAGTGNVNAGAGGSGNPIPMSLTITKL